MVRIGDSTPAPNFRLVAQPNDWEKHVKAATAGTISERSQLYWDFWEQSGTATASPTTAAAPGAVAVVGSGCYSGSTPVVDLDGVRVYCARMESSDSFVWSRVPGVLSMPQYRDWQTTVCVQQTGRTAADCTAEIARASYWGDGTPPP